MFQIQIGITMFKTITFLVFLTISQAPIFAQVKSLDFNKKSRLLHAPSSKNNMTSSGLKTYSSNRVSFQKLPLREIKFNSDIGIQLMSKRTAIKGPIDLDSGSLLGLINKYQFRQDLNKKSAIPIARIGVSQFN